ncbi:unnamed protein product [Heligmosomoides polygyrus]|uniref:SCP domain-containing protein n=1 Tax=Heligmosomoides polygyrus TaxID=6339 RepID=A0A183FNZ2_HELPZ|nr:unnamed protein product [Heligmosomoides polygyrus]
MKYDRGLEVLAQNYADQCPTNANGSAVATRPDNGENVKIIPSNTVPFYDAVLSASQSWWDEIAINGVNHQMRFTDFLQTKPLAPIRWTQLSTNQCGFISCRGTVDAIPSVRLLLEKHCENWKPAHIALLDMEKTFDRIPREVMWSLRHHGVPEELI